MGTAREILPTVKISDKLVEFCAYLVSALDVKTHRAEINLVRAGRAIAAYHGRTNVTTDDLKEAAYFILPHRMQVEPFEEPYLDKTLLEKRVAEVNQVLGLPDVIKEKPPVKKVEKEIDLPGLSGIAEVEEGEIFEVGDFYASRPWDKLKQKKKVNWSRTGKRLTAFSKNGPRHIGSKLAMNQVTDIDVMATIRAASPHQRKREKRGTLLSIQKEDIREKIRKKKIPFATVFVIDSSGSMSREKMERLKGHAMSLIKQAYLKRDKIGLITFRNHRAQRVLPLCPRS